MACFMGADLSMSAEKMPQAPRPVTPENVAASRISRISRLRILVMASVTSTFRHDSLHLCFWIMPKVHEQAQFHSGGLKIILDLRAMLVSQLAHGLQLEHHFSWQMKSGS